MRVERLLPVRNPRRGSVDLSKGSTEDDEGAVRAALLRVNQRLEDPWIGEYPGSVAVDATKRWPK